VLRRQTCHRLEKQVDSSATFIHLNIYWTLLTVSRWVSGCD
jgi:hypothetical protein